MKIKVYNGSLRYGNVISNFIMCLLCLVYCLHNVGDTPVYSSIRYTGIPQNNRPGIPLYREKKIYTNITGINGIEYLYIVRKPNTYKAFEYRGLNVHLSP